MPKPFAGRGGRGNRPYKIKVTPRERENRNQQARRNAARKDREQARQRNARQFANGMAGEALVARLLTPETVVWNRIKAKARFRKKRVRPLRISDTYERMTGQPGVDFLAKNGHKIEVKSTVDPSAGGTFPAIKVEHFINPETGQPEVRLQNRLADQFVFVTPKYMYMISGNSLRHFVRNQYPNLPVMGNAGTSAEGNRLEYVKLEMERMIALGPGNGSPDPRKTGWVATPSGQVQRWEINALHKELLQREKQIEAEFMGRRAIPDRYTTEIIDGRKVSTQKGTLFNEWMPLTAEKTAPLTKIKLPQGPKLKAILKSPSPTPEIPIWAKKPRRFDSTRLPPRQPLGRMHGDVNPKKGPRKR